jgi:hypothetical protein
MLMCTDIWRFYKNMNNIQRLILISTKIRFIVIYLYSCMLNLLQNKKPQHVGTWGFINSPY